MVFQIKAGNDNENYEFTFPVFNSLPLIFLLMFLLWLVSLLIKDASIVDRFWGLGFVSVSLQHLLHNPISNLRSQLVFTLVCIWGLRLSLYIHFRNKNKPEDSRYQKMRASYDPGFWWKSFFIVFSLQGFLMWIISAPLASVFLFPQSGIFTLLDFAGLLIWIIGFLFEAIADYQLSTFKKQSENKGKVCRIGLWNLSRHPNYFGESLIWWGYFFISLNTDCGYLTLFSPVLMTYLLLKVSGVNLLEKQLKSTKAGYTEYLHEVPAFFPRLYPGK